MSPSFASSGASCASATTNPGLDVVESLYRGANTRPGLLQPYEPSLRPPEGTVDFGWLFRPDPETTAGPLAVSDDLDPVTGSENLRVTATASGLAAVMPTWPIASGASARRWPAAALLAVGLAGALLLPWVVRSV